MMAYFSEDEIKALILAFESCTLPRSRWTHSARLTVALWYLIRHPRPDATRLIREGIQRHNAAMGIPQTQDSGYHETITLFWIEMVARFLMEQFDNSFMLNQTNTLLQRYDDPRLMLQYYSCDRLTLRLLSCQFQNFGAIFNPCRFASLRPSRSSMSS
jgi:hypothetical protein